MDTMDNRWSDYSSQSGYSTSQSISSHSDKSSHKMSGASFEREYSEPNPLLIWIPLPLHPTGPITSSLPCDIMHTHSNGIRNETRLRYGGMRSLYWAEGRLLLCNGRWEADQSRLEQGSAIGDASLSLYWLLRVKTNIHNSSIVI